jgi:hypothetical protein
VAVLSDAERTLINAYRRAANYLTPGQIYLLENPLLEERLTPDHIKKRLAPQSECGRGLPPPRDARHAGRTSGEHHAPWSRPRRFASGSGTCSARLGFRVKFTPGGKPENDWCFEVCVSEPRPRTASGRSVG